MAKRALLIGINRYLVPGADLRGCVNDVRNLKRALMRHFGFQANAVVVLTDLDATRKAMQRGIETLLRGAKSGDVLLLHYSGHGSNVPDDDGDEAENRDEILCPADLDWKNPLRDDWLRKAFDGLPARVSLTVIMDCCHSGTNTRLVAPPDAPIIERYLPSPWDLVAEESRRRLRGEVRGSLVPRKRQPRRKKDVVDVDIPEVLITGCRDTQTSADAYIGGSYNGALTYNLVAVLDEKKGRLTYGDLHARVIRRLRKDFDQVPQLEGRRAAFDRPFLSSVER
ncbi:MAG: caspase family protein [Candidatus Binatia bacterium]